jgi:hypothetical protein
MKLGKGYRNVAILGVLAVVGLGATAAHAHDACDDDYRGRGRFDLGVIFSHGNFGFHFDRHERESRPRERYIPGHYETRTEDVLVEPAHEERQWVPPVYQERFEHGRHCRLVVVREGYYECIRVPARYECRTVRVWVPGHYERC